MQGYTEAFIKSLPARWRTRLQAGMVPREEITAHLLRQEISSKLSFLSALEKEMTYPAKSCSQEIWEKFESISEKMPTAIFNLCHAEDGVYSVAVVGGNFMEFKFYEDGQTAVEFLLNSVK